MIANFLTPCSLKLSKVLKIQFNFTISWKKIKEKMFEREKYYKDYEMQSYSLKVDQ